MTTPLEVCAFHAKGEDGWTIDLVLFTGKVEGELRASQHGELRWTHPVGLAEIALFASERTDLLMPFLDGLMQHYRVH